MTIFLCLIIWQIFDGSVKVEFVRLENDDFSPCCSSLEQVVGVWRNIDDNYLWVFQWRRDHIKASKIRLVSIEEQAEELETLPISSEGLTSISFMENEHCCMSSYIVDKAKMLMMSPNKHAENACNVALGSHADVSHQSFSRSFLSSMISWRVKTSICILWAKNQQCVLMPNLKLSAFEGM